MTAQNWGNCMLRFLFKSVEYFTKYSSINFTYIYEIFSLENITNFIHNNVIFSPSKPIKVYMLNHNLQMKMITIKMLNLYRFDNKQPHSITISIHSSLSILVSEYQQVKSYLQESSMLQLMSKSEKTGFFFCLLFYQIYY